MVGIPRALTTKHIEIETSGGVLTFDKVEFDTEFMDSDPDLGCKYLLVWFNSTDTQYNDLYVSDYVYIIGDDGSKTEKFGSSGERLKNDIWHYALVFMPPNTAHKFTLYWPGNEPIELPLKE